MDQRTLEHWLGMSSLSPTKKPCTFLSILKLHPKYIVPQILMAVCVTIILKVIFYVCFGTVWSYPAQKYTMLQFDLDPWFMLLNEDSLYKFTLVDKILLMHGITAAKNTI